MSRQTADDIVRQAFAHHQAGDLGQAEQLYRAVLAQDPDHLNALQLLGALDHATGRTPEAIALFGRAVATLSAQGGGTARHAALYNNLGNALRDAGRGAEAIACYRRGLDLDPQVSELHANLGREQAAQHDLPGAIASYEAAYAIDPRNHHTALGLAGAYAAAGRRDDAIARLRHVVDSAPAHHEVLGNLGRLLASAGRHDDAIAAFRSAAATDPSSCSARLDLAAALVLAGRLEEAVELLACLANQHPDDPAVQWDLATALHGLNRSEDALIALARLVALRPDDARAHLLMGGIHQTLGNLPEAMGSCRAALRAQPDMSEALLRLAMVLADLKRPEEAIEACRRLLAAEPDHAPALCVLGNALAQSRQGPAALEAYVRCLRIKPDYVAAQHQLGVLLKDMGQHAMAATCLQAAIDLKPDHVGSHIELGNVLQNLGRADEARQSFMRAQALQPLTRIPAAVAEPDFAVLVIISPGAGNTPYKYLIGKSAYESHFYALLPGSEPDLDMLRRHGDAVVNLISDVDQGRDILTSATALVDTLGKPVINHPDKVVATGRDDIAQRLAGIAHCRMPKTIRCNRDEIAAQAATFGFPLLLRTPGTHGGDAFEKIDSGVGVEAFLSQYPGDDYYVTEYVDYAAADGYFRKYRMMVVDGVILPYHLAIADQWKIHHFRTEMGSQPWMQQEEAAFLDDPHAVFGAAHETALHEIARIVDLEFFGVDCSVDHDGNLLIFEVNASMLIHDDNADFPYKAPHVARIKASFDALLARKALAARIPHATPRSAPNRLLAAG
jgi:tetratricopeptide (TPR) repeat protein/glutathione synthase/RimK-type ligase-like ATP-grasp enzyme